MSPARKLFVLVMLGVVMVALAATVLARNRSPDDELLGTMGIVGAIAILVVALPPTDRR